MSNSDVNKLINENIQSEDTYKEDKIKIANKLVKNFSLLKELNLLSTIKSEIEEAKEKGDHVTNVIKKEDITYDDKNVIYANRYIIDFLQLKEQNAMKESMNEKRKSELSKYFEVNVLNEKDMINISNTLQVNELNLSTYAENIMGCDELNNFNIFNRELFVKHIDIPTSDMNKSADLKILQILKLLIKNYNNSLNLIKLQQNVINDFIFYTHNLLKNKKKLIKKNEHLIKNNSVNSHLKTELTKRHSADFKYLPFTNEENISSIYRTQIDLYRKHISHLYNENDILKKYLNKYNVQSGYNA
ncbi:hypothetical protein, conserved [Plasmodium gonderi]|uniref:Uncharacterized protein n=1 Tax=Plasmodium gonderi TaxID=77519 RepID=A0A1Y1JKY1_PLAGO|nr:hypothetical protein, conserved [Plasmodium gonderi]GAW82288.1 hypothetical protein, conserved [Plasmodium gonderi]